MENESSPTSSILREMAEKNLTLSRQFLEEGKIKKARLYLNRGRQYCDSLPSIQAMDRKIQQVENHLHSILARALELQKQGNIGQAFDQWKQLSQFAPENERIKRQLEIVRQEWDRLRKEQEEKVEYYFHNRDYRRVLLLQSEGKKSSVTSPRLEKLYDRARELLKKADEYLRQAVEKYDQRQWREALVWTEKALDCDWKKGEARELKKKCVQHLESHGDAMYQLEEIGLLVREAYQFFQQKNWSEALKRGRKILALEEGHDLGEKIVALAEKKIQQNKAPFPRRKPPSSSYHNTQKVLLEKLENLLDGNPSPHRESSPPKIPIPSREERSQREVEAILTVVDELVQEDRHDLAIRELDRALERHPNSDQLQRRLKELTCSQAPTPPMPFPEWDQIFS